MVRSNSGGVSSGTIAIVIRVRERCAGHAWALSGPATNLKWELGGPLELELVVGRGGLEPPASALGALSGVRPDSMRWVPSSAVLPRYLV